jgi:hypothetical protein
VNEDTRGLPLLTVLRCAADALEIQDCRIALQRRERSRRNGDDELIILPRLDRAAEAGNVRSRRRSESLSANDHDVSLLPRLLGYERRDDDRGGGDSEKNACDVFHEHLLAIATAAGAR